MRRFVAALALIAASGCSNQTINPSGAGPPTAAKPVAAAAPVTTTSADGAARVAVEEASKAIANGTAVLVDVRTDEQYATEHAKGAIHIPVAEIATRVSEVPQGKFIITYCS